jgi:hypothetical protein
LLWENTTEVYFKETHNTALSSEPRLNRKITVRMRYNGGLFTVLP